jgi:hypothetical protein
MPSQKKDIYKAVKEIIATVPAIKYFNWDLGQLDFYSNRPAIQLPCCLVDFNTDYKTQQFNNQHGKFKLSVRLAFDAFNDISSLAPDDVEELGLQYLRSRGNGNCRPSV